MTNLSFFPLGLRYSQLCLSPNKITFEFVHATISVTHTKDAKYIDPFQLSCHVPSVGVSWQHKNCASRTQGVLYRKVYFHAFSSQGC